MDIQTIRKAYPILNQSINDERFIYFDNAATSQTPQTVIQAMVDYYQQDNANIHRGVHALAQRATDAYEKSRQTLAQFIGAQSHEVIFTRGTTEGMNFLTRSLIEPLLKKGDGILTTRLEHHSTLVPIQAMCQRTGAQIHFMTLTPDYQVDLSALQTYEQLPIKVMLIQHVSNVLGVVQDLPALIQWAHDRDILVIVDGAQAVAHQALDVRALDVDAYCFSGHKMYGPTGIGVCYLADRWHDMAQPHFYGGEMIHEVGDYESNYKEAPWKFEAGTMPISQVVGLAKAVEYVTSLGLERIHAHEHNLTQQLYQGLIQMPGIQVFQESNTNIHATVSFNIKGIHPHDAASAYDLEGIAIRAGHHCCQPLMRYLDVEATLRASLAVYNTTEEVTHFLAVTEKVRGFFHGTGTIK